MQSKGHRFPTWVAILLIATALIAGACSQATPTTVGPTAAAAPQQAAGTPKPTSAATPVASAAKPVKGGTLTVGIVQEPNFLDPALVGGLSQMDDILYAIYNPIISLDKDFIPVTSGALTTGLTRSWDVPDDKTIVLHLQEGVKFHDGTDGDAEAVKFNIDRVLDPKTKAPLRDYIKEIDSVEVKDKTTLVLKLKRPAPYLLEALGSELMLVVSPTAVKKWGADFSLHPVGTGPFKFTEWVHDDHVTLERFDGYWEPGLPYLDKMIYQIVPDETIRAKMLEAGQIDESYRLAAKDLSRLESNPDLVVKGGYRAVYELRLNSLVPPFDKKELRQAVSYAVDREDLLKAVLLGRGQVAVAPVASNAWFYPPNLETEGFKHDPAKAKELMVKAGFPNGFEFEARVRPSPEYVRMAELMKAQLTTAGITMNIRQEDYTASRALFGTKNFQAIFGQDTNPGAAPALKSAAEYLCDSPGPPNYGKYCNPEVDKLLNEAAALYDLEKRKALYQQAMTMIEMDAPHIHLLVIFDNVAMSKKVNGYVYSPVDNGRLRPRNMWLTK